VARLTIPLLLGIDVLRANKMAICCGQRLLIKHLVDGGIAKFYFNDLGDFDSLLLQDVPCFAVENVTIAEGQSLCVPV
jgi:hypothetical protein